MRQRRPLIEQLRRKWGLPATVQRMEHDIRDLLLAPREEIIQQAAASVSLGASGLLVVRKNSGANVGTRGRLNLIEGANVTLTVADDATDAEVDVTVASTGGGVTDHGALTGLADDDHAQHPLLAGRGAGQDLAGGTAASGTLTLRSTAHATKGKLLIGTSAYDELNNRLGIAVATPTDTLHINGGGRFAGAFTEATTNPGAYAGIVSSTPRILLANGVAAENWQVDNFTGAFRWFLPGVVHLQLTNAGMGVKGWLRAGDVAAPANVTAGDLNGLRAYVGANAALLSGLTAQIAGAFGISANNALRLYNTANTFYNGIRSAAGLAADLIYILPLTEPAAGQILSASAPVAGVVTLSWVNAGGGGGGTLDTAYDFGGAGLGRFITADAGAVRISAISTALELQVPTNIDNAISVFQDVEAQPRVILEPERIKFGPGGAVSPDAWLERNAADQPGTAAGDSFYVDQFVELKQIAAPGAPGAGETRLYTKTDGRVYRHANGGTETEIGAVYHERATQAVVAGTTVVVTDGAPLTPFTLSGNVTSTAAPFIAAGRDGQLVILRNDDATDTLTLSDTNIGAGGSLLRLSANTVVMAAGSTMALEYSTIQGAWVQLWYLALVTVVPAINTHTVNIGAGAANSQNAEIAGSGTHTPTFAWTYTGVPTSGTVNNGLGGGYPATILTPFLSLVGPAYNKPTVTVPTVVTFTPSIVVNTVTKTTPTATVTYINRRYAGPNSQSTLLSSAQVLALDGAGGVSDLNTSQYGTFAVTTGASEYFWFAHRSALTAVAFFSVAGEIMGFTDMGTISHTNDSGFAETFRLYRSTNQNFGAASFVSAAARPNNRIYMGPHAGSDITSAQILTLDDTAAGDSEVDATVAGSYTVEIDAPNYLWFCHPDAIADLVTIKDAITGFGIGGAYQADISHTNDRGFVETYRRWRSTNTGIFPTAQNVDVT